MAAGVYGDFPERIHLFDRHPEFFLEKIQQAGNSSRSSRDVDFPDVFTAGRGAEEIERLLDFEDQNVRHGPQDGRTLLFADAGEGSAIFSFSASSKLRSSSFCK